MKTPLDEWQNFYVIVGSAAGGLSGLQFLTMALIADSPQAGDDKGAHESFATPPIVYFATALVLATISVAPWQSLLPAAALWGLGGFVGVVYTGFGAARLRAQHLYKPVWEDWIYRTVLPSLAYGLLIVSALQTRGRGEWALFEVAGASLSMLLIGLHNAWDNVTYLVLTKGSGKS